MLNSSFFLWMGEGCHLSGGATGRAAAEAQAATLMQQAAALTQQVAALTPHVAMLRSQTLRMHNNIGTAHTILSRIDMHPNQAARWCGEAIQILESELSD
jgi:hypothetical protein